jgi:hypothetical protein
VTRNNERDESIDKLLREGFRSAQPARAAGACVEPEVIAAWTEGRLPSEEAAQVETHLASCALCQETLAVFARTEPAPQVAQTVWQRWRLQWAVPLAAAATAVAIWVASPARHDQREGSAPVSDAAPPPSGVPTEPAGSTAAAASPLAENAKASVEKKQAPLRADAAPQEGRASVESRAEEPARAKETDQLKAASAPESAARDRSAKEEEAPRQATAAQAAAAPAAPATSDLRQNREAAGAARPTGLLRQTAAIEIVSSNQLVRWRILSGGGVEHSTTGGTTWEPVTIQSAGAPTAGSSPDPLVCWLVGPDGYIARTVDGMRFQRVPFPESTSLVAVRADSASAATVTAADGRRFRTEDQGMTWRRVAP